MIVAFPDHAKTTVPENEMYIIGSMTMQRTIMPIMLPCLSHIPQRGYKKRRGSKVVRPCKPPSSSCMNT